jgi:hypothetical protein
MKLIADYQTTHILVDNIPIEFFDVYIYYLFHLVLIIT